MSNQAQHAEVNGINARLRDAAKLMEEVADTARKFPTNQASDVFSRHYLPMVESIAEDAEQLLAAARRCKHALRTMVIEPKDSAERKP